MEHYFKKSERLKHRLLDSMASKELGAKGFKKIMVIDDCKDTLNIVKRFLNSVTQFSVLPFDNEFAAINQFMREKPDLLILDMNLQELDGIRLSIVLKNLTAFDVPILYISQDRCSEKELIKFHKTDVDFIAKPLKKDILLQKVSDIVASSVR